jgi:hypothetical protein
MELNESLGSQSTMPAGTMAANIRVMALGSRPSLKCLTSMQMLQPGDRLLVS